MLLEEVDDDGGEVCDHVQEPVEELLDEGGQGSVQLAQLGLDLEVSI